MCALLEYLAQTRLEIDKQLLDGMEERYQEDAQPFIHDGDHVPWCSPSQISLDVARASRFGNSVVEILPDFRRKSSGNP